MRGEGGTGLPGGGHRRSGEQSKEVVSPLLEKLNLGDMDRSDELFSMNFEPDLVRLRASVKQMGVLEPVWVRQKGQRFQIISGFRRFDVASALGEREVPALIWKGDELDDRLAFQMSLHGNVLGRGLNLVEKALVLEKLLSRFSVNRDEVIQTFLPLVNLEPNENVLNSFLLINTFSIDLKRYLLSRGLSLANIMGLAKFSREERDSIRRFLSPMRVGENVLREMLTFLWEISRREGIGLDDLLSGQEIRQVLADSRLSGPQKIQAIRRFLREKRYPRLSELEERFRSCRKAMKLSPQVAITPPPFFEGDRFKIEIRFENLEEYEAILGELQNLPKKRIGDLLKIKGYGSDSN